MSSTTQAASDASTVLGPSLASQTSDAPQNQQGRGGRAMGGSTGQGEGSGRGRGGRDGGARRGRGPRGANSSRVGRGTQEPNDRPPPTAPPPGLGGGGSFGARLIGDADKTQGAVETKPEGKLPETDGAEAVEAEVCFICASPVVHNAVSPCNHRTCHICALRLRALYKTKACAHCRANAESVIFTDDAVKRFEEFQDSDFIRRDDNLGIKYESPDIFEDTVLLLRYNCPDGDCDVACLGWPDLHRHVRSMHHKVLCDLCTRNKKVFTHEHELLTQNELRKHEKFGDDNPGAIDQSGFKGHPECGFCRQRFYGDDELYTHCRDKHERCHICDRRNQGRKQQYFVDYDSLEVHFRKDHFLCADQECLEKKFVVFESEIDLKAHQLEAHPNGLSKDARKEARRIDISGFDYRASQMQNDRGGGRREGRGRGRGRDPNTDPIPQSTAQPLRRDELAYQRQMAIQSAQSVAPRTFGGQLTSSSSSAQTEVFAARPPPGRAAPETTTARVPHHHDSAPSSSLSSLSLNPASANHPPSTPQEQARQLRHTAVMERASHMLKTDPTKVTDFRAKVSRYQKSAISASGLIDSFFSLFDTSATELGKLVKELAEIYEVETKRNELLKAWNDWRAINEDYPALPGPSGVLPGGSSDSTLRTGGARVLKLKSSTAQSSRSHVSRQGSWGSASGSSTPFPPMPAASSSATRTPAGRASATPWTPARASPATSRPSSRPSSRPPPAAKPATATEAFPALPAAAKPTSTIFGYGTGAVRRDVGRAAVGGNAWAGGGSSGASAAASDVEGESGNAGGGKKKGGGNRNKKQMLFQWG